MVDNGVGEANQGGKAVHCRVIIVGLSRPRVAKVVSLLRQMETEGGGASSLLEVDGRAVAANVEFLPCVATFDSYEDENGRNIRYLIRVNYHGPDGTSQAGSSLAPFFDQHAEQITGVAIGCGVDHQEDVQRLQEFFHTLRGHENGPLTIKALQPNREYSSMKEETEAFKTLSVDEKKEATRLQTLGPGKMAKFVTNFCKTIISNELLNREKNAKSASSESKTEDVLKDGEQPISQSASSKTEPTARPRIIDANKLRYACQKCRTILFGDDDMEEPPHAPARHKFSMSKVHHGGVGPGPCKSYFLSDRGLDWAGDMTAVEGKFLCPNTKCNAKLGTWHWAGAQCSCGTWVSPSLQIPFSKVDVVNPRHLDDSGLPSGAMVSPHMHQRAG